jgi:tight adherence protein B
MISGLWIFVGLVFLAVFLLAQGTVVPVFGEAARMRKRLTARLSSVANAAGHESLPSLLREKYLKELSPLERSLETLPAMTRLARLIEQSGESAPAYQVVGLSLVLAAAGAACGWLLTRLWDVAVLGALVAGAFPYLRLLGKRAERTAKFEEQLPEALDVIKRALRAGHPFSQCLKLVAEDMEDPISHEFDLIFSEINYGNDVRPAMHGLLERMPSVSVMAFVTAVLVQKETGGNLAETLERISAVIRGRFRLHRRVRTLSAEGRMSAWVLALVPLFLFALITVTTPDYLPTLTKDALGRKMIAAAVALGMVGIVWIRRIIRIRV